MRRSKRNLTGKVKMNVIHFRALTHRYFELIFSDKVSFILLILQAPIMLAVIAIACNGNFLSSFYDAQTALFVIVAISSVMGTLNSYREVCKEREVLMREYATGLDATAYVMSKFAVQAAICLFHAVILTAGSLFLIDFPLTPLYATLPNMLLVIFLCLLSSSCLGILISCLLKNSESAVLPVLFIIIGQMVLSNTIIQIPKSFDFITFPVVTKWGVAALGALFQIKTATYAEAAGRLYDLRLGQCYLAFAVIIVLSVALSVVLVRRILVNRHK